MPAAGVHTRMQSLSAADWTQSKPVRVCVCLILAFFPSAPSQGGTSVCYWTRKERSLNIPTRPALQQPLQGTPNVLCSWRAFGLLLSGMCLQSEQPGSAAWVPSGWEEWHACFVTELALGTWITVVKQKWQAVNRTVANRANHLQAPPVVELLQSN